jgi:hypothetical protein
MKNSDDQRLLAHKRKVDAERKAAWEKRQQELEAERKRTNVRAMHAVASHKTFMETVGAK